MEPIRRKKISIIRDGLILQINGEVKIRFQIMDYSNLNLLRIHDQRRVIGLSQFKAESS